MMNEMKVDCTLLNEYTKWNLYKNGKLISSGNLSPEFDGNVLGDTMRLTNIQEDLEADSLDLFQIINEIEDEFDVKIETEDGIKTVKDLVDYVEAANK